MPSREVLEAFAAMVEANDHVGAIKAFYAENAQTLENDNPPRVGRDALIAREQAVLDSVVSVRSTRLKPLLLDGDHSAICWRFEFTRKDGSIRAMEEVAWQRWDGDKIVEERFFYDPKQMAAEKL